MAFTGSITGTVDFGIGTVSTTADADFVPTEGVRAQVTSRARLTVDVPAPKPPLALRKVRVGVTPIMSEPIYLLGRPYTPRWLGRSSFTGVGITGLGHMRAFVDPDPVWNGSSWDVPPPAPPPGASLVRWSVRTLPDPAGFAGGHYQLGQAEAGDGTSSIAVGARQWASAPGSDVAIALASRYPFKPTVISHLHYAPDGSQHIETAGVRFSPAHLSHLWADMGTFLTPPFTILAVLIILDYPRYNYFHSVFDSGYDPTGSLSDATRTAWLKGVGGAVHLGGEDYGYRTGLRIGRKQQAIFTDQRPGTRVGWLPYHCNYKPKMVGMVVNGSSSMSFDYSATGALRRTVKLADHGAQRFLTVGRVNGLLDTDYASSMVVFEIRAWNRALNTTQLQSNYDQLSSTWKFHEYK